MQPNWATGDWSNCTAVASSETTNSTAVETEELEGSGDSVDGECPGIRLRNVFCEQIVSNGLSTIADESLCEASQKPQAQKLCTDEENTSEEDSAPQVSLIFTLLFPAFLSLDL